MEAPEGEGVRTFKRVTRNENELYLLDRGLSLLARRDIGELRIGVQGKGKRTMVFRMIGSYVRELTVRVRNGPFAKNQLVVSAGGRPSRGVFTRAGEIAELKVLVVKPYREWVRLRTDSNYANPRRRLAVSMELAIEAEEDLILESIRVE
jgi:hypothetical protein